MNRKFKNLLQPNSPIVSKGLTISIFFLFCNFIVFSQSEKLELGLTDVITLAQSDAPNVLLAKTRLATYYWSYQSFLADFKPQIDLGMTPIDLNRSPVEYLKPNGQVEFLRRTSLNSSFDISVSQSVSKTGGRIFAGTGLNYFYNFKTDANPSFTNYFATPIYVGFNQPLFGFNEMKWNKRIEPLVYSEATKRFAEETETIARVTTELFFDVYIAQINLGSSQLDKTNADTLYSVAQGRYSVGRIAETDLLQIELSVRNAEASLANALLQNQTNTEQLRNYLGIKEVVTFDLTPPDELPTFIVDAAKALEEAYAAEKIAEEARAKRKEAEQGADIIVPAQIDKRKIEIDAEAEAEQIRRIAKGEADAIFMKKEAEANADSDKAAKEKVDKINGADAMIFQTEKQISEFGDKLSDDKKAPIESALTELKAAHQSQDVAAIDASMEKINEAWKNASEEMYKAQQEQGPDAGADAGEAPESNDSVEDVTDVEFEEVDDEKK